ncbi:MAG: hypothetical protein M5U29_11715 [Anaerolineae bacterium]|nr:hypothetical protein [Anaerolineae bacterium]
MVTTKDELFSELLALRTEISSHLADMDASDDLTEGDGVHQPPGR